MGKGLSGVGAGLGAQRSIGFCKGGLTEGCVEKVSII